MSDKIIVLRCHLHFGQNKEAIADARQAVKIEPISVVAKEILGKALYSAGQFENALVEFHKADRIRPNTFYEEWILRCEETIKAFLTKTVIDCEILGKLLEDEETKCWLEILTVTATADVEIDPSLVNRKPLKNQKRNKEIKKKEKNERKKTGILMGKLHEDMMFLDKIANHPALQKSLLDVDEESKKKKDIDHVLREIRGAALDGLGFLQVRKTFWETSEPPAAKDQKKNSLRRSRSDSSRQENRMGCTRNTAMAAATRYP